MNCTCLKFLKLPLTAAFVIAAFSAQAADIYTPAAAPAYAAVALPPSWGGFYAGINGGYGGNSGLPFREDVFFSILARPYLCKSVFHHRWQRHCSGGFGGGQIGYNFQFGSWVFGAEADLQGSGIRGNGARTYIQRSACYRPRPRFRVCQRTPRIRQAFPEASATGRNVLEVTGLARYVAALVMPLATH